MNSTVRDLDDNLEKAGLVESLVREAREELQELTRSSSGSMAASIPRSVWTKVRQALVYYGEVSAFLLSIKS